MLPPPTVSRRHVAGRSVAIVLALLVSATATAQSSSQAPVDDLVQRALRQYAEATTKASPAQSPMPPSLPLTLDAAVKMALEKNPNIAVQRANPEIAGLDLAAAKAVYLPIFSSTIGDQRQVAPPVTILTGGGRVTTTTGTLDVGASQNVPAGGGTLAVGWTNTRVLTDNVFYNFNPTYNSGLTFQYTQPLLRGFRTDQAREQIAVSRINRDISEVQLQAAIANTVSNVRNAYWDLVFAVQSVDVARQSVDLAQRLVQDNEAQVRYGTMTRLDLATSQSQEASSRHALLQAEGNRRLAELALKRLLVDGPRDPLWQAAIDPQDRPSVVEQPIDLAAAVRRALDQRTDLRQAKRQAAANEAASAFLRDQVRPQADLVASYGLAGVGGTQLIRAGDGFGGPVVATIPGGYGDALQTLVRHDYPTWNLAVTLSYPVGTSAARAAASRAAVQTRQMNSQIREMEIQVVNDVTSAAIQAQNDFDQVETARTARQLAEQRLDAEQKKFHAGISTNYFVVQAQRDLADARNAQLQAEVNYRKALVEFERAQQTTLESAGVTIVSTGSLSPPPVGSGRGPGS